MGTFQKKISNTLVPPSQKNSYSINIVSMKITLLSLGTILFAASLSHALPAIDPSITVTFLEGSELVKLDKIIYTNGKAAGSFDLQLCINDTITNQDATVVIMEANTQTNIAGTQDATDAKCFDFTQVKLPSDKETVRYDLHLHQGDAMSGPFGRVIYAFRKLDKVTNFQCAGEAYSRVVYPTAPVGGDSKVSQTCIDNTNVCYMHGSSSASGGDGSLCLPGFDTFTSKGMTYCQPGTVENKTLGDFAASSLHYDGNYNFKYDVSNTTYNSEAILSVAGKVKISKTAENKVAIDNFAPGVDVYTVCAVQLDQSQNIAMVATSNIQDLNVHGADEWGSCQMNLDNNHHTSNLYQFSSTKSPTPVNVDCKRSPNCYGYVDCTSAGEMTVTYETGKNVIVVPYADLTPYPTVPTTTTKVPALKTTLSTKKP